MDRHPNLPPPGRAVQVYQDEAHYPTRVVFVLDTSGSMRGKRMADLRRALGEEPDPPIPELLFQLGRKQRQRVLSGVFVVSANEDDMLLRCGRKQPAENEE